jgi:hypothetical protein
MALPKHYTSGLSKKDKKKQLRSIKKSKKAYKSGKYVSRPKLKSFKSKKSSWTQKFHKKYPDVKSIKQISDATGIPRPALLAVKKKVCEHIILQAADPTKQLNHGGWVECIHIF